MQNTEIISCSFLAFMQHCMWSSCCSCPIPWFMALPNWTPPNTGVLLIHYEEFVRLLPFSWLSSTSVKKSIKWESKLLMFIILFCNNGMNVPVWKHVYDVQKLWGVSYGFFLIIILIAKHNHYIHYLLQVSLQYSINRKTLTLLTMWITLSIQLLNILFAENTISCIMGYLHY